MRWSLLAITIGLAAGLAGATTPAERARAQNYYQRGVNAEAMSDAAFRNWLRTIQVRSLDNATDRWLFAVDQYSNATYYDPAHWRAHKRLGFLLANVPGAQTNEAMAVMHLVAYMALAPNDPQVLEAKTLCDQRLRSVEARMEAEKLAGEHRIDADKAIQMGADAANDAYLANARKESDEHKLSTTLAQFQRSLPDMFAEQANFYAELAERIKNRLGGSTAAAGGMEGMPGGMPGGGMPGMPGGGAPSGPGGPAGGPGVVGGAPGGVAASTTPPEEVYRDYGLITAYVPVYLGMMGGMHRFMTQLDGDRVAYDARVPEMLIGESMLQLRRLFTRGRVGGAGALRQEYQALAKGEVRAVDFWNSRSGGEALPEYVLAAGQAPKTDILEQLYSKSTGGSAVRMPAYNKGKEQDDADHMARDLNRAMLAFTESQQVWLAWRNIMLSRTPQIAGLRNADVIFASDYQKVGSGQFATWTFGPLPKPQT